VFTKIPARETRQERIQEKISEEVRHQGTMKQETEKKALSMF
jgi:hypothetical protein